MATKPPKRSGFTLIEVLIALGLAATFLTAAFGTVGQIYFYQKRIQLAQNFYSESRFVMERLVQIIRNHTLDYDEFFIEMGPPTDSCSSFDTDQVPQNAPVANGPETREEVGYPTIFFWDTDDDPDETQDRNLGGALPLDGSTDPCSRAFAEESIQTLYLINGERNVQKALTWNTSEETIELRTRLGADLDNDNIIDEWTTETTWQSANNRCVFTNDTAKIVSGEASKDFCLQAHDFTAITPFRLQITSLLFEPSPDRDPFLAFRVDEAQIHPHVFTAVGIGLRNPEDFGFNLLNAPRVLLQTSVSSRIYGNTRN